MKLILINKAINAHEPEKFQFSFVFIAKDKN